MCRDELTNGFRARLTGRSIAAVTDQPGEDHRP
jgi:hypothetical protein